MSEPGSIKLKTLHTGKVTVPTAGMLNLDRSATEAIDYEQMKVAVFAHWLKHPQQGDFLIDSGLDRSFADHPQGNIHGLLAGQFILDSQQSPGQDIVSQLTANNIELQGVFFTHLHGDHSAGAASLPTLPQYVVAKGETYINIPLIYSGDHLAAVDTLLEIDFANGVEMPILGKVVDVWGDHSLLAISTPGHSAAHMSFLVNTTDGWVLMTGDVSHTRWGFEHGVEPGWATDRDQARASFEKLVRFVGEYPAVRVIYGHEM